MMMKQLLRDIGLTVVAATIGGVVVDKELTTYYVSEIKTHTEQQHLISYKEGFQAGRSSLSGKDLALQDHKFSSKLCRAWWFDLNATQRSVH